MEFDKNAVKYALYIDGSDNDNRRLAKKKEKMILNIFVWKSQMVKAI